MRELDTRLKTLQGTQKQTAESTNVLARSTEGLTGLLQKLAGLFAVEQMAAFGKSAENAAAEIGRLSDRTGVSVEILSAMRQAAEDQNLSLEDLGKSFKYLSRSVTELESGSPKAVRAFAEIGLSAKDLKGLSLDQVIQKIADALARFADSPAKATLAMQLFGRFMGDQLLPVLKEINAVGLSGLTEEARKIGALVTPEQAKQAREFNAALSDIKLSLEGLARTTLGQVLPSITRGISDLARAIGTLSEKKRELVGSGIGISAILGTAGITGAGIGALFGAGALGGPVGISVAALGLLAAVLYDIYKNSKLASQSFEEFVHSTKDAAALSGSFTATSEKLQGNLAEQQLLRALPKTPENAQRLGELKLQQLALQRALEEITTRAAQLAGPGNVHAGTLHAPIDPELLKAQFAALKQAAEAELALVKLTNQGKLTADQAAYDAGKLGVQQFYADRRAVIQQETDKELDVLKRERVQAVTLLGQATPGTPEAIGLKAQVAGIDAKIAETIERGRQAQAAADAAKEAAQRKLGEERLGYEQKILTAQGQTVEAALIGAELEVRQFRELLARQGVTGPAQDQQVAGFEQLLATRARLTDIHDQASEALADLDRQRQAITNQVAVGTITEYQGQVRIAALEASRLPQLQELAKAALVQANALGDPKAIANAEQLGQELSNLAASANLAGQQAAQLKQSLISAGESDLSSFLSETALNARTAGDAIRSFAESVVTSLLRIESQLLASRLFRSLLGGAVAGGLQLGQLATSSVNIAAGASPEIAVAQTLFGAVLPGHARGGWIGGSGSGDTVPIMATPGEFVVNAASAGRHADLLHAINHDLVPRHFALGGMVLPSASDLRSGGGASTLGGGVEFSLAPGLVAQAIALHLESADGQRSVVNAVIRNPREVRDVLRDYLT